MLLLMESSLWLLEGGKVHSNLRLQPPLIWMCFIVDGHLATLLMVKHSTQKGKTNLFEFNFFIEPSSMKPPKTKYSNRPTVPHKHLTSTYHMHTPTLAVAAGFTTDLKSGLLVSEVEFGAITANLRIQPLVISLRPIDGECAVREDKRQ